MCISALSVCMPAWQKRASDPITVVNQPVCWELNSREEQPVLLNTEHSLQLLKHVVNSKITE